MDGHIKMTAPGNGGSGGGDGKRKRRTTKPSGTVAPISTAASPEACNVQAPMPVYLERGTLIKFGLVSIGPLVLALSAGLAFYWKHHFQAVQHRENTAVHLLSGEKAKLETKPEAQAARKEIVKTIKSHVDIKVRELRVEQRDEIQKLGNELKAAQKKQLQEVLSEVKRTRRDVRAGRAYTSP